MHVPSIYSDNRLFPLHLWKHTVHYCYLSAPCANPCAKHPVLAIPTGQIFFHWSTHATPTLTCSLWLLENIILFNFCELSSSNCTDEWDHVALVIFFLTSLNMISSSTHVVRNDTFVAEYIAIVMCEWHHF